METPQWDPGSLLRLAGGYWQIFTLHTAVKLDVFTVMGDQSMTARQIALMLNADERGVTLLLNALSAMELLEKEGAEYRCVSAARRFLNRTADGYIGHMILHHHHLTDTWSRMDEAVKSGKPLTSRVSATRDQRREAFLMGMYNIASQQAPAIASEVDLSDRDRLLDLGGGPGTYAIHFCKENPSLQAVVFDLPTTRPFAEKTIEAHGLSERIAFTPGDYTEEEIPGRYDAVWISHILHAEGPEVCQQIIEKAAGALAPGGLIIIHDFLLVDTMDGPLMPALFALNMLQGTEAGQSYSEGQVRQMLKKAGVSDVRRLGYVGPTESGLLVGTLNR